MKNNLEIYNNLREVPKEAQKPIGAGRLKGMTDINPMWRIKALTEEFGACGVGWYTEPISTNTYECNGEVVATMDIKLYYKKSDGTWSEPLYGTGGSKLVSKEKNGLYINDEAFKMAYTDAISVAGKLLGLGADVYWNKDNTKYNDNKKSAEPEPEENVIDPEKIISKQKVETLKKMADKYKQKISDICRTYNINRLEDMNEAQYGKALMVFKSLEKNL